MVNIFISYSHNDNSYKEKIYRALHPMVLREVIHIWQDGELLPGVLYDKDITDHLMNADIAIYLLSIDFFNSEYIHKNEYEPVIEKWKGGKVKIAGVMLTSCDYTATGFARIKVLPRNSAGILIPLNMWDPIENGLMRVVEGIKELINEVLKERNEDPVS